LTVTIPSRLTVRTGSDCRASRPFRAAVGDGRIAPGTQGRSNADNTRNDKMKIRNVAIGLVLSVFAASSLASSGLSGHPAPDFALKSSSGENLRLSEYRGDVVMINFWATWCGPCRQEMPLLDELYTRYQRVGFSLLGVNIDDDSRRAMDMINELGVSFPVLFDARKEVSRLYKVDAMPVTVIVDREGNVRHVHQGYKPGYEQKYLDEIRSLLRE
jgi:peroxiredoxin